MIILQKQLQCSALVAIGLAVSACGGSTPDAAPVGDTVTLLDDQFLPSAELRELVFSEEGTEKKSIVQCFCDSLFRSTLLFYHFLGRNAVLVIEFDNTELSFPASGVVHLFDEAATEDEIGLWINNQHSDGLFINPAEPFRTVDIENDDISITSSAYTEGVSGFHGDEYEKYQIEFAVSNHMETAEFFLNGFSDQTDVYLQTRAPSFTDVN